MGYEPYFYEIDQIDITANEDGTDIPHDYLTLTANVTKPGYIYIYLSNENDKLVDTFFDDFKITHTKSPIISADDYYPFGLAIQQHSYQREGATDQKYKFQGQEHQDDLGLGWVQFKYRMHDPAIGRFMVVDPLADGYVHNSPYAFSENKVTGHIELEGLESLGVGTAAFILQTNAVANVNSGGNPGVGDFIRAAAQVAFFSTRIGGGLAKFSQGAQLKVSNTGDFAQNAGSNIQEAIDSGTDPNAVQQNFEQVDSEANALLFEGGADIVSGAVEIQSQLIMGAMTAGSSSATTAGVVDDVVTNTSDDVVNITKAYARPNNATTAAQRASVQGKPCVDCGAQGTKMVADHKIPLVQEYYQTGKVDKIKMRGLDSVQPQCTTCSNKQGGRLSNFSKQQKKKHGFD